MQVYLEQRSATMQQKGQREKGRKACIERGERGGGAEEESERREGMTKMSGLYSEGGGEAPGTGLESSGQRAEHASYVLQGLRDAGRSSTNTCNENEPPVRTTNDYLC